MSRQLMIVNERHLRPVLRECVAHYNHVRPHQALELWAPDDRRPRSPPRSEGQVVGRPILGRAASRVRASRRVTFGRTTFSGSTGIDAMGARTQYRSGSSRRLNVFSSWHFVTLLSLAGWPRKVGFLRREVRQFTSGRHTRQGAVGCRMAIGAFDIRLACALVAQSFDRQEWGQTSMRFCEANTLRVVTNC